MTAAIRHKRAWIFAGQGAQRAGMGTNLIDEFPIFRRGLEEASDATGLDLVHLSTQGTDDEIKQTEVTQPLMLAFGASLARVVAEESGDGTDFAAGHSLGEITALCATGAIKLHDAARLVHERGREMQACVEGQDVAMAAMIGIESDVLELVCMEVSRPDDFVVCANYNAPGQTVISGHRAAVERAIELAKTRGARRSILLPVSAAFHSPLMAPMKDKFAELASSIVISHPTATVYANVDAMPYLSASDVPNRLTAQLDSPVRWTDEVRAMVDQGVGEFVEFAPVPTLSSMVKRTTSAARAISITSADDLRAYCLN